MKKNKKTWIYGLSVVFSLLISNVTVMAATHEHAYSYMGNRNIEDRFLITHTYDKYNPSTGMTEVGRCEVYHKNIVQVWKCACGDIYYVTLFHGDIHTSCGR